MRRSQVLGRDGEDLVARYAENAGWTVLDRNWRAGRAGELDLVALDGRELVAVEVKTRRGTGFGHPSEAVTPAKLARVRRLAARWLDEHDVRPDSVRVDVVAVLLEPGRPARVEHLVGVQ